MTDLSTQTILRKLASTAKLTLLFRHSLIGLGWGLATFLLLRLANIQWMPAGLVFSLVWVSYLVYFGYFKSTKVISNETLVEHLNCRHSVFEESAQLILKDEESLNLLQRIQKQRNEKLLTEAFHAGKLHTALPRLNFILIAKHFFCALSIVLMSYLILLTANLWQSKVTEEYLESQSIQGVAVAVDSIKIDVTPPSYTQQSQSSEQKLSFSVIEGSQVSWRLKFNDPQYRYVLVTSEQQQLPLSLETSGVYSLKRTINKTLLYSLAYFKGDALVRIPGVHSVAVVRDRPPKIKVLQPNQSLLEFAKTDKAQFAIQALVSDDFGVSSARILASVAKGSGEAVKFRDESFEFSNQEPQAKGILYRRAFLLTDLQMEPGDEAYFSIIANDNKQPKQQQSKSSSVIIRWLDDEPEEIAAEGIRINFVPEYFRSQRQIIIETEQLIADRKELSKVEIDDKSRDLGHSQRDLKEKYGQYLGDEFGEGPGEQFGLADGYHGGEDVTAGEATAGMESHDEEEHEEGHHDHDDNLHQGTPEVGHLHEEMVDQNDKSGASELIARFAHNHGSVEVGPMSRRDPKSWMKRAVSIMWQAELHLMMSEPEKALPFEYEAYEYLKLARQADRIYVKRLGFEPPPVKESARLTGELKDVLSYNTVVAEDPLERNDSLLFKRAHRLLTFWQPADTLKNTHKQMLRELADRLIILSESRPVLVQHAATIENILLNEKIQLNDCENCVNQLKHKLWQLLPPAISQPRANSSNVNQQTGAYQNYLRQSKALIQQNRETPISGGPSE